MSYNHALSKEIFVNFKFFAVKQTSDSCEEQIPVMDRYFYFEPQVAKGAKIMLD